MNTIEERLKDSLGAVAETLPAEAVPELRLPARRSALRRRLVPAIAAGAVVAATVGVAVILPDGGPRHPDRPATTASPLRQTAAPPRHYLAAVVPNPLAVYETATRRQVARTSIRGVSQLAGTGDGHTYFALVNRGAHGQVYRIRITDRGDIAETAPVPVTVRSGFMVALAASRDGTKLALAVQLPMNGRSGHLRPVPGVVEVADLATGTTATWRSRTPGLVMSVAMDPAGSTVAFDWQPPGNGDETQIRALDVSSSDPDLLASRVVVRAGRGEAVGGPLAFAPDGRFLAAAQTRNDRVRIVEYPMSPGRPSRVLVPARPGGAGKFGVVAFDATGTNLLFQGGGYPLSRLANGKVIPLGESTDTDTESSAAW